MRILALLPLLALAPGCHNACQKLCDDIFEYAQECGFDPSKDELKACYDAEASSEQDRDKRAQCRMNAADLKEEWDCEDLVPYFDPPEEDTAAGDPWIDLFGAPSDTAGDR